MENVSYGGGLCLQLQGLQCDSKKLPIANAFSQDDTLKSLADHSDAKSHFPGGLVLQSILNYQGNQHIILLYCKEWRQHSLLCLREIKQHVTLMKL